MFFKANQALDLGCSSSVFHSTSLELFSSDSPA